jgi:hypothetical protein
MCRRTLLDLAIEPPDLAIKESGRVDLVAKTHGYLGVRSGFDGP